MEVALGWASTRVQDDILVPPSISAWDLGAGESQVLSHCLAGGHRAVLDDGEARGGQGSLRATGWQSGCHLARPQGRADSGGASSG